mgnify:CR=1 FL=1|jgi:hypothetical protein
MPQHPAPSHTGQNSCVCLKLFQHVAATATRHQPMSLSGPHTPTCCASRCSVLWGRSRAMDQCSITLLWRAPPCRCKQHRAICSERRPWSTVVGWCTRTVRTKAAAGHTASSPQPLSWWQAPAHAVATVTKHLHGCYVTALVRTSAQLVRQSAVQLSPAAACHQQLRAETRSVAAR